MRIPPFVALAALLPACSSPAPPADAPGNAAAANAQRSGPAQPPPAPAPAPAPTLSLAGYDGIVPGQKAVDAGHGLADEHGYDGPCSIWTSKAMPGFYLLVEDGIVQRISLSSGYEDSPDSPIRTDRGIGIGDPVARVRAAYSGLRQSPHAYTDGIYLDWLPGGEARPGLRFEVTGGKVTDIHAGLPPALFYVEGCS